MPSAVPVRASVVDDGLRFKNALCSLNSPLRSNCLLHPSPPHVAFFRGGSIERIRSSMLSVTMERQRVIVVIVIAVRGAIRKDGQKVW